MWLYYKCLNCDWEKYGSTCLYDGIRCPQCQGVVRPMRRKEEEKKPLLTIEVKDMQSVPVVKYKGEDITGKVEIDYHWRTSDSEIIGEHEVYIEHCNKEQLSVEKIEQKRIFT